MAFHSKRKSPVFAVENVDLGYTKAEKHSLKKKKMIYQELTATGLIENTHIRIERRMRCKDSLIIKPLHYS